ncbi:MAG: HEAT repeat domain-containing protein [Lentisphaeria bacterium]|nr:HEAT repeat domain-containing protein [Lentisphaeria bacterium]
MNVLTDLGGAILYFTALLPIWNERPLTREDLVPGPYPVEVTDRQVAFAQQGFTYADEDLLNAMIVVFGKSHSAAARDALLKLARDQGLPSVVATVLLQAGNLPLDNQDLGDKLAVFFTHDDGQVRFWAVTTYGKCADLDPTVVINVARKDPSIQVKTAALEALTGRTGALAVNDFYEWLDDDNRGVRHAALRAAMGARNVEAGQDKLAAFLVSPDSSDRHALAEGLALLPKPAVPWFGQKLAADEHPSVRAECAVQLGNVSGADAQKMLIGLLADKDYEVRRSAVESLALFPDPDVIERLVAMLGDKSKFVRWQLEETLVALHPRQAVDAAVAKACRSQNPDTRLLACNVLGRVGVQRHRDTIAQALPAETRSVNIAAALTALDRLAFAASDTVILPHVTHADTAVRLAAAKALGNVKTEAAVTALVALAADLDNDVVAAAIQSMGRVADPMFSKTLLKILKDTGPTARYLASHRAQACWAAAKIPDVDKTLTKRLVEQGSEAVIKTKDGNLFESDHVLVSAIFALAERARRDPAAVAAFNRVYSVHSRKRTAAEIMGARGDVFTPSPELLDYSAQAKAWLDNLPARPGPRPKRSMKFLYRPVK